MKQPEPEDDTGASDVHRCRTCYFQPGMQFIGRVFHDVESETVWARVGTALYMCPECHAVRGWQP